MAKKKNIKREKFSNFTFFILASVLAGLIISGGIRVYFHEYIPQANLFGETGLIKEPRTPMPYNQGDFFRPLFGMALWVISVFIVVFIINFFRKNFAYNFIRLFGYTESKKDKGDLYRHQFWLFWLIGFPVFFTFLLTIVYGIIHLINYQFNTSLPEASWVVVWFSLILIYFLSQKFK